MHLVGFQLRSTRLEWKLALKIPRYYVSPESQTSARYKWQYTAASREVQVPSVAFTSDGSRSVATGAFEGSAAQICSSQKIFYTVCFKDEIKTKISIPKNVFGPPNLKTWLRNWTEVGTWRLIHELLKQTQFCVSFITLWSENGSFQTTQSSQFLNLMFTVNFRGISRLGSTFIFLRWFQLSHICIQVTSLHKGDTSEWIDRIFY